MQRVLIADDSIVSRHLLEATLKKWGYEVTVACDGAEAWSILEQDWRARHRAQPVTLILPSRHH